MKRDRTLVEVLNHPRRSECIAERILGRQREVNIIHNDVHDLSPVSDESNRSHCGSLTCMLQRLVANGGGSELLMKFRLFLRQLLAKPEDWQRQRGGLTLYIITWSEGGKHRCEAFTFLLLWHLSSCGVTFDPEPQPPIWRLASSCFSRGGNSCGLSPCPTKGVDGCDARLEAKNGGPFLHTSKALWRQACMAELGIPLGSV